MFVHLNELCSDSSSSLVQNVSMPRQKNTQQLALVCIQCSVTFSSNNSLANSLDTMWTFFTSSGSFVTGAERTHWIIFHRLRKFPLRSKVTLRTYFWSDRIKNAESVAYLLSLAVRVSNLCSWTNGSTSFARKLESAASWRCWKKSFDSSDRIFDL